MSSLRFLLGLFCQLPQRSPQVAGQVFPLCHRCAGLHLGVLASYSTLLVNGGWRRRLPEWRCLIIASLLMVPYLVDGWGSVLHLWSSPGWLRALTGVGYGVLLPPLLVPAGDPSRLVMPGLKPTLRRPATVLGPFAGGCAAVWLLINSGSASVAQVLGWAAGIAVMLLVINCGYIIIRLLVWVRKCGGTNWLRRKRIRGTLDRGSARRVMGVPLESLFRRASVVLRHTSGDTMRNFQAAFVA